MTKRLAFAALTIFFGQCLANPAAAQTLVASVKANPTRSIESSSLARLERLAAQGDPWAADWAGRIRFEGTAPDGAVKRDLDIARVHLELAARNGSPGARMLLDRISAGKVASADGEQEYVPGPGGC